MVWVKPPAGIELQLLLDKEVLGVQKTMDDALHSWANYAQHDGN